MKYEGESELMGYRAFIARHHDSLNIKAGIERLDIKDPAERDEREEGKKQHISIHIKTVNPSR